MAKGDQIQITIYPLPTNKITAILPAAFPSNGSVAFFVAAFERYSVKSDLGGT